MKKPYYTFNERAGIEYGFDIRETTQFKFLKFNQAVTKSFLIPILKFINKLI